MAVLRAASSREDEIFPMFTLLLETFLEMRELQKHERLLELGGLYKFHTCMGRAMLVSHQWLSAEHPDPRGH